MIGISSYLCDHGSIILDIGDIFKLANYFISEICLLVWHFLVSVLFIVNNILCSSLLCLIIALCKFISY